MQEVGNEGAKRFTYDKQGGIIKEESLTWIRQFTYNSRHQQTRVETENGDVQENRYDAEGLRFELLENGRRTSFIYHNGELLYREGREGAPTSYHLGAGIEAFQREEETYYYHQDEQLSTALITDEIVGIRNSYQYDAFGNELDSIEQFTNHIRYTGQQYDDLTGQYYLRARYYNPELGRFMQEDVYQGDGLNLYAYCSNNPVVYYDPSGYKKGSNSGCPPASNNGGDGGAPEENESGSGNKPYTNSRPPYGKNQVNEVWENAKDPITGKVYDPSGVEITWDKTKSRNGQWDMGHIPGEKYSEMHQLYIDDVISKDEFLEWYRNPKNYRPELPGTNRSHKYE